MAAAEYSVEPPEIRPPTYIVCSCHTASVALTHIWTSPVCKTVVNGAVYCVVQSDRAWDSWEQRRFSSCWACGSDLQLWIMDCIGWVTRHLLESCDIIDALIEFQICKAVSLMSKKWVKLFGMVHSILTYGNLLPGTYYIYILLYLPPGTDTFVGRAASPEIYHPFHRHLVDIFMWKEMQPTILYIISKTQVMLGIDTATQQTELVLLSIRRLIVLILTT